MKENKSKDIIIILLLIIIVILGVFCALFATDTISLNSKLDANLNEDNKIQDVGINYNDYIGVWYQNESLVNQESIKIKKVNDNLITMNIFFYRIASMQDVDVYMNENIGTFTALTEALIDDGYGKVDGTIMFEENQIVVTINSSTIGLQSGKKYSFAYKNNQ